MWTHGVSGSWSWILKDHNPIWQNRIMIMIHCHGRRNFQNHDHRSYEVKWPGSWPWIMILGSILSHFVASDSSIIVNHQRFRAWFFSGKCTFYSAFQTKFPSPVYKGWWGGALWAVNFKDDILESGSWRIMEIIENSEFGSFRIMRYSQIMIMDHGSRSWSKTWILDHDHGPDWILLPWVHTCAQNRKNRKTK